MNTPNVIKKNKPLVVVLAVSLLITCFMIYECICVYAHVQETMQKIEEADKEIQKINKKSNPNPVRDSATIIEGNTKVLQEKTIALQRKIGNPYRDELLGFIHNLESAAFLRSGQTVAAVKPEAAPAPAAEDAAAEDDDENKITKISDVIVLKYTETDILDLFKTVYDEYYQDRANQGVSRDNDVTVDERNEIFNNFRERMCTPSEDLVFEPEELKAAWIEAAKKSFDKAMARFKKNISEDTLEDEITDEDANHIMMQALGLPRTMASMKCKYYIDGIQIKISKNPDIIPGLKSAVNKDGKPVEPDAAELQKLIPNFTFNHNDTLPPPGNVVHIIRHYQIIEDLFKRMRLAKISKLVAISSPFSAKPSGALEGDTVRYMDENKKMDEKEYKKFVYEVTVESEMDQIRAFVNILHKAYEQNRVYEIEEMSFMRDPKFNEVRDGNSHVSTLLSSSNENNQNVDEEGRPVQNDKASAEVNKAKEEDRLNQIYSAESYGAPLIGQHKRVVVRIKLNYLVYIGSVLDKR